MSPEELQLAHRDYLEDRVRDLLLVKRVSSSAAAEFMLDILRKALADSEAFTDVAREIHS